MGSIPRGAPSLEGCLEIAHNGQPTLSLALVKKTASPKFKFMLTSNVLINTAVHSPVPSPQLRPTEGPSTLQGAPWGQLRSWLRLCPSSTSPSAPPLLPQVWSQEPSLRNSLQALLHLTVDFPSNNKLWAALHTQPCLPAHSERAQATRAVQLPRVGFAYFWVSGRPPLAMLHGLPGESRLSTVVFVSVLTKLHRCITICPHTIFPTHHVIFSMQF